ncbi:MAG TPA: hypothetical protein VIV11_13565 [Kofleriaceae bacterium]
MIGGAVTVDTGDILGRTCIASVLCVTACYSPRPGTGAPCPDGECPSPLVCSQATRTCELTDTPGDADVVPNDAPADVAMPTTDALACFGSGLSTICIVAPTGPLTVPMPTTLDTGTSPMCLPYSGTHPGEFCVIAGTTVDVTSTLVVRGARPLVVIASGVLTISGTISVASRRAGAIRGAGANPTVCGAPQAATAMEGGAGGSFGGRGGTGGLGEEAPPGPAAAPAVSTATVLRGGCRGGNGTSGAGGDGGGALYLIAGGSIAIMGGTINASGAGGGRSTENNEGGGGGGSGGMIALEAPTVSNVGGQVFANGGGGGGGNESSEHGGEAMSALVAAPGGRDLDHSGDGGDGSAGATLTGGDGQDGTDGGGGGGAGAGVIRVFADQPIGGSVSPPPT